MSGVFGPSCSGVPGLVSFHFIYWFIQIFTILFSHCPQIAKASLGGQCLFKTK